MASELVVVRSKVKEAVKKCNVSGDFAEALSEKVLGLIQEAEKRATANGRKTVQPKDL